MKKSGLIIGLVLCVAIVLASCSSESGAYKIGVLMYNYTDIQGLEVKAYGEYLEDNFNVEFEYVVVGSEDDKHVQAIENLIAQGVDGIISGYETVLKNSVDLTSEAGIYYSVMLAKATQDLDTVSTNEYFLGGIEQFGHDSSELGAKYAEAANEAGLSHIGITSFQPFLFLDAPNIISGFNSRLLELNPNATVYDPYYHMFDVAEISNGVTNYMTENSEMDGIFALGSGMDFIYPALVNSGQAEKVKLLTLGYNASSGQAFMNDELTMGGTSDVTQALAYSFALIYDHLEGTYYDHEINGSISYPTFSSKNELDLFKKYTVANDKSQGSVTAEELKQVMKSFNENATYQDLLELSTRTLDEIDEARS